jgi:bacterioferritin|nr:ferritin-like domain-containing protein [Butyrivibrio sp.]
MANENIIKGLQAIVTDLAQQADGHAIQSKIFGSLGFSKLADKYDEHATEERGYVDKCIDRILDLGGEVKNEDKKATPTYTDPVEWIKYDLKVSVDGLASLKELVECSRSDYNTYDILSDYYKDEEEDMYWGQQQLDLIAKIGVQNWLTKQL